MVELHVLANKIQPIFHQQPVAGVSLIASIQTTWKCVGRLLDFDVVDAYRTDQSTLRFILSNSFTIEVSVAVEELYLNFLHDPKRAGKYHINQDVYARIVLQCIKYICGEPHE